MDIMKNNNNYCVTEYAEKWVIKSASGKLSVAIDVSKEICKTEDELHNYILSNEMF